MKRSPAALGTEQDPVVLAYRIASLLNLTLDGEQQLLEAATRADLLRGLYAALSREVQILQLTGQDCERSQRRSWARPNASISCANS